MTEVTGQIDVLAQVSSWFQLKKDLSTLKAKEGLARAVVFDLCFKGKDTTKPEGTNKFELPEHYQLKAVTSLNRKPQIEVLRAIAPELATMGVVADDLIRWTPELDVTAYRALTDEQRKFFDQALLITEGSPQLDVVLPAKFKSKGDLQTPSIVEEVKTPF